jgi:hypothetical protein
MGSVTDLFDVAEPPEPEEPPDFEPAEQSSREQTRFRSRQRRSRGMSRAGTVLTQPLGASAPSPASTTLLGS